MAHTLRVNGFLGKGGTSVSAEAIKNGLLEKYKVFEVTDIGIMIMPKSQFMDMPYDVIICKRDEDIMAIVINDGHANGVDEVFDALDRGADIPKEPTEFLNSKGKDGKLGTFEQNIVNFTSSSIDNYIGAIMLNDDFNTDKEGIDNISELAIAVYNNFFYFDLFNGEKLDVVNFKEYMDQNRLKIELYRQTIPEGVKRGEIGTYLNYDAVVGFNAQKSNGGSENIGEIGYSTEFLVTEVEMQNNTYALRLQPHLVARFINTPSPTVSQLLMATLALETMATPDRMYWMGAVKEGAGGDIGVLNLVTPIDLTDVKVYDMKNASPQLVEEYLRGLNPLDAVTCIEIPRNSTNLMITNLFAGILNREKGIDKVAGEFIIEELHEFTNGMFPANFPYNNIIEDAFMLPEGTYTINGEKRPLDEINLQFIYKSKSNLVDVMADKFLRAMTGEDSFVYMVEIYAMLGLRVNITGRKMRIYFSSDFKDELIKAFDSSGMVPKLPDMNIDAIVSNRSYTRRRFVGTSPTINMNTRASTGNRRRGY